GDLMIDTIRDQVVFTTGSGGICQARPDGNPFRRLTATPTILWRRSWSIDRHELCGMAQLRATYSASSK
ncbi:hypothetical protein, partial [Lactiplantibacillus pentosus]